MLTKTRANGSSQSWIATWNVHRNFFEEKSDFEAFLFRTCSRSGADCQLSGLWIPWTQGQKVYLSLTESSLSKNHGHLLLLQQHCKQMVYTTMKRAKSPIIKAAAKVSNETLLQERRKKWVQSSGKGKPNLIAAFAITSHKLVSVWATNALNGHFYLLLEKLASLSTFWWFHQLAI